MGPQPYVPAQPGPFTDPTPGGIWSSSNTAIGTVDPVAGVVGGITAGTVTITYSIITGTTICSTSYTTSICPTPVITATEPITIAYKTICKGERLIARADAAGIINIAVINKIPTI